MVQKARVQSGVAGNVTFGHCLKEVNELLKSSVCVAEGEHVLMVPHGNETAPEDT